MRAKSGHAARISAEWSSEITAREVEQIEPGEDARIRKQPHERPPMFSTERRTSSFNPFKWGEEQIARMSASPRNPLRASSKSGMSVGALRARRRRFASAGLATRFLTLAHGPGDPSTSSEDSDGIAKSLAGSNPTTASRSDFSRGTLRMKPNNPRSGS